ncbi:MAG TPA: ABC transporter permease [Patescibacteria group bacterium]|nr:ABC transporter permease [Patescibacteria group bacterium]
MPRFRVPGAPVVVIESRRGWRRLHLAELWAHRELLYYFVWRDLKVRYKQTFFGAAWAVLQPALLMVVFSVSLGRIPGVGPSDVPYPLFVFAGLVPWTLFAQGLAGASTSLVGGEAIITKVYFPRLLLPFAAVISFLPDLAIGLGVLVLLMAYFGTAISLSVLWLPALAVLVLVTALGAGTLLGAFNVRYRDVKYVVPFLVQILLFASPVVYSSSLIPERWLWLYSLNPMVGVVEGFRWAMLGGTRPDLAMLVSALVAAVIFVVAMVYFERAERTFADVI